MKHRVLSIGIALCAVAIAARLFGQESVEEFVSRKYTNSDGATMPYRLFIPRAYDRDRSYPLVVYLHGGGGLGSDNLKQISGGNTNGTQVWISQAAQSKHPAFVIAPQAPEGATWGGPDASELSSPALLMLEILEGLQREFSIDRTRLYLTGQSLGGFGTWDIIIRRPDLFAAAVPLCGGGSLNQSPFRTVYRPADVETIKGMPIWVFHGADDESVPVQGSREMVATLRKLGSKIKYTEYPRVGHAVWEHAYAEPALIDWMFAQRRFH